MIALTLRKSREMHKLVRKRQTTTKKISAQNNFENGVILHTIPSLTTYFLSITRSPLVEAINIDSF